MEENPGSAGPVAVVRRRSESRSPMVDRWSAPGITEEYDDRSITTTTTPYEYTKYHNRLVLTEHLHPIPTGLPVQLMP
ncbi:hypothetical protein N7509_013793 [Penicillium cosmopolitanum]|uniref:Uncharacterized protein n=1 Tax=Penicillium cosmopolitanum TaxID=1131564 RepID=A0A9W9SEZ5_9EURO|nr:uncharacterized protein N7509_013793 [Penicillium cosmopolitanum]KAJ5376907.1 hypothetical protein N7509_013793 [Penicillium cosmopolitanum]